MAGLEEEISTTTLIVTTNGTYLQGTADGETLTGDATLAGLIGMGGNDMLLGGSGDNLLLGDYCDAPMLTFTSMAGYDPSVAGNDVLYGGAGNDTLVFDAGTDALYGGEGDDVYGVFPEVSGTLHLQDGSGVNEFWFQDVLGLGLQYFTVNEIVLDASTGISVLNRLSYGLRGTSAGDTSISPESLPMTANCGMARVAGSSCSLAMTSFAPMAATSTLQTMFLAGAGNDSIWGGDSYDVLKGDDGRDRLFWWRKQ